MSWHRIDPNEIFSEDDSNRVDFEIAFAALVITGILALPSVSDYPLLKGIVVSLSGLTLIRKMAVSNEYRSSEPILGATMPFILSITAVSLTFFFLEMGRILVVAFNLQFSPVIVAVAIIPLFTTFVFLAQEWVFHDANLYLALLANNGAVKAANMRFFGVEEWAPDWFRRRAGLLVTTSRSDSIPQELRRIENYNEKLKQPNFVPLIVTGVLGYGAIWVLVNWIFGFEIVGILFLIFIYILLYPVRFWYSRFGLARFSTETSGWRNLLLIALGLTVAYSTILPNYA